MKIFPHPESSHELHALAQTLNKHDVLVSVRCFKVAIPKPHFEILLKGRGESAIVDVADHEERILPERIELSAESFARALLLRSAN